MTTLCYRCNRPMRADRCASCERMPSWCRCAPVEARREPIWLERSRERRTGLARDLGAVA